MAKRDFSRGPYNNEQSKLSDLSDCQWTGPVRKSERWVWSHPNGTEVEVYPTSHGAARDEWNYSVLVRGKDDLGRKITNDYFTDHELAFQRAERYCDDHPKGELPTSSTDEWGVEI